MTRIARRISLADQQHLVLHDVTWKLYERLLRDVGNRPVRVTFYRGSMEIMSPRPKHEKWKKRIARLIELMLLESGIRAETLGSTTFRREAKKAGLEPDECYYVQNAAAIRGKDRLDLSVDPPPDVALEVDITRRSIRRMPVYAALSVPEIWRWNGKKLAVLLLSESGYVQSPSSPAFPFLPIEQFQRFLDRLGAGEDELTVLREFQQWVRTLSTR